MFHCCDLQELKLQVLATDVSGHCHGARHEQSGVDDGRPTLGILLEKSTDRGQRRCAAVVGEEEEEEADGLGIPRGRM